ncbi:MAG TPA: STAS domain-containing protein [bacterium]|nr:STAS domain-containing protein [bacterium]HXB98679.1 STAS domain-containing protein [bacterium]
MEQPIRIQVLRLRGELNLEDMLKIKTLVAEYLKAGLVHVVINLENVSHVHLAGLPVLGERAQRLREYGGDLKLVGLSPYLRHIFDLAGATPQFDLCKNEEEASNRFSGIRAAA